MLNRLVADDSVKGASKNSEFAQMQGVEKISPRAYTLYVSKKFFPQRSSWDEIWILRGFRY